jgi:hypothetical protein
LELRKNDDVALPQQMIDNALVVIGDIRGPAMEKNYYRGGCSMTKAIRSMKMTLGPEAVKARLS